MSVFKVEFEGDGDYGIIVDFIQERMPVSYVTLTGDPHLFSVDTLALRKFECALGLVNLVTFNYREAWNYQEMLLFGKE